MVFKSWLPPAALPNIRGQFLRIVPLLQYPYRADRFETWCALRAIALSGAICTLGRAERNSSVSCLLRAKAEY